MTGRRQMLATVPAAAAAGAVLLSGGAAPAQPAPEAPATGTPAAGQQAPGFYRARLGGRGLLLVNDGFGRRPDPRQNFVRNASPQQVETALRDSFLPVDRLTIPYTVPFLETARGLVAFDIGTGGHLGDTAGRLLANLRAAGFAPSAVAAIVFTHFHPDHVSGLTDAEGKAVYPNAVLHVPEPEWDFWTDEARANAAPEAMRPAFRNVRERFAPYAERVRRFAPGAEVMPGVRSVATPGHTPGHTSYLLSDDDRSLMVLGDVTNRPELFARNPGWHVVFDMDPAAAEASRRRVFDMLASDRVPATGYHWPFPALAHLAKDGEGYRYAPVDWSAGI